MKALKKILLVVLLLIALVFIAALIAPKTWHAEGTSNINKPISEVYDYVKNIRTQEKYAIWFKQDPQIIKEYYGTDGELGSGLKWKSEKVGNGEQKIVELTPNKKVVIDLYLMDSSEPNKFVFELDSIAPNKTKVRQFADGKTPIPFNLMSLFFNMNKSFQENADYLKKAMEK